MAHVKTASLFADVVGKGAFTKNSFGLVDTGDFDGKTKRARLPLRRSLVVSSVVNSFQFA